ncbi:MAG: hypothetical protein ABIH37_04505 [archaeon]
MEEFEKNLQDAVKHLKIADHMTYVTFPLVNEHRLLLKIFDEIYLSIVFCVNTILNYEYLYKRIKLYSDYDSNLDTFIKVAKNYSLSNEQIKRIKEIINLNKKHKKSAIEFVKRDKVVIMSDNLGTQVLDLVVIKQYLLLAKELLMKVNGKVKN